MDKPAPISRQAYTQHRLINAVPDHQLLALAASVGQQGAAAGKADLSGKSPAFFEHGTRPGVQSSRMDLHTLSLDKYVSSLAMYMPVNLIRDGVMRFVQAERVITRRDREESLARLHPDLDDPTAQHDDITALLRTSCSKSVTNLDSSLAACQSFQ